MRDSVRAWPGLVVAAVTLGSCHLVWGEAADPLDSPKVLKLTTFAAHPQSSPESDAIDLLPAGDGSGRIFVSTNEGKIVAFSSTGTSLGVFLDIASSNAVPRFSDRLGFVTRGLSYIAFHPDYARAGAPGAGKLYTLYKTHLPAASPPDYTAAVLPTKPGDVPGRFAIVEWSVDEDDPSRIDPGSFREVFVIEVSGLREDNHSVGKIAFNPFTEPGDPDHGVLYFPLGDMYNTGGHHDWQHVQDRDNPFGKVLRIHPLQNGDERYSIPADNPFADGGPLLDDDGNAEEIAAVGFRYPENLSFAKDGEGNARVLVFDIGADDYEELNLVDVGDNHGWPVYDGPAKVDRSPEKTSTLNPSSELKLEFPAAVYDHDIPNVPGGPSVEGSAAIAGGFVVSDPNDPEFQRQVIFSDLPRGAFFHASLDELVAADAEDTQAPVYVMSVSIDGSEPGLFGALIEREAESERGDPRFGIDEQGRVFITSRQTNTIYLTELVAEQLVSTSSSDMPE